MFVQVFPLDDRKNSNKLFGQPNTYYHLIFLWKEEDRNLKFTEKEQESSKHGL